MVLPYCRHSGVCASSPFSQAQEGFPGGGFAKLTPLLNRPKTWSAVPSSFLLASSCSTHSLRFCLAFFLASQKCLFVETDLHWIIFCIFSMEFCTFHDLRVWGSLKFAPWKLCEIFTYPLSKLHLFLKSLFSALRGSVLQRALPPKN